MKISPVEAELFHVDRRTDMTDLIVAFAILRTRQKLSRKKTEVIKDYENVDFWNIAQNQVHLSKWEA